MNVINMRKSTKKKLMGIIIALAFLGSIITGAISFVLPANNQPEVFAVGLEIVIFNELQPIPAEIGISNDTTEKLYTLNSDNIIYKSTDEAATLGDFFNIWGETFNSTCIFDYCNSNETNSSMKMYVCSNCLQAQGNFVENKDYQYYTLNNMDVIRIDYR